jgi:hypothetical protein
MLALAFAAEHSDKIGPIALVGCGTFDRVARARLQASLAERRGARPYDYDPIDEPGEIAFDERAHRERKQMILQAMLVVAAASNSGLTLSVSLPKSNIFAGEPLKVLTTWKASSIQSVDPAAARILIDDGTGYHDYDETSVDMPFDVAGVELNPGSAYVAGFVLAASGQLRADGKRAFAFPFPNPGTYKLKVTYGGASSNETSVSVAIPQGLDAALFTNYLRKRPDLLTPWGVLEESDFERLDSLLQQYKGSAYAFRPQLLVWEKKIEKAVVAYGASGGTLATGSPISGDLGPLLAEIESADWTNRPFDEDRLVLAAETRLKWGDRDGAIRDYQAVVSQYPEGSLALNVRTTLAKLLGGTDTTAPTLQVAASPSSLWPPDHKLVPITVTVQASDDTDPHPTVKLVSITCNDACDPALDVVGAKYGTDDRQFEVRAERKGTSSSGRTYTIKYSAEDASGNKGTATTTVTVRHDQGKK